MRSTHLTISPLYFRFKGFSKEQSAYLLFIFEPLSFFRGKCFPIRPFIPLSLKSCLCTMIASHDCNHLISWGHTRNHQAFPESVPPLLCYWLYASSFIDQTPTGSSPLCLSRSAFISELKKHAFSAIDDLLVTVLMYASPMKDSYLPVRETLTFLIFFPKLICSCFVLLDGWRRKGLKDCPKAEGINFILKFSFKIFQSRTSFWLTKYVGLCPLRHSEAQEIGIDMILIHNHAADH